MITPAAVTLIVREAARAALDEIVRRDAVAQVRTEAEADAARAQLEQEIARLRAALRLRNGEPARGATRQAMSVLQIPGSGDAPAPVEREVLGTLLDVKVAELAYEDGTTLEQATRDLRARLFPEQTVMQIAPPVMLSAAIAAAHRCAVSLDMARKVEATGKCMLGFRGDMPLELFLEGVPARLPALASPPAETARQEPQAKQVQQDRERARQARRHRGGGRRRPQDHR